jgi:hypothetical protein
MACDACPACITLVILRSRSLINGIAFAIQQLRGGDPRRGGYLLVAAGTVVAKPAYSVLAEKTSRSLSSSARKLPVAIKYLVIFSCGRGSHFFWSLPSFRIKFVSCFAGICSFKSSAAILYYKMQRLMKQVKQVKQAKSMSNLDKWKCFKEIKIWISHGE